MKLHALFRGGKQERGRRAGTENVPGLVGLGAAAELALLGMNDENARVKAMRDRLEQGILQAISHCRINGDPDNRLPNTSNIAFTYVEGEAILHHLDRAGVAASSGSACASGSMEPSHVLRAMKVPVTALQGAIRFSLSRDNSDAEIDRALAALPPIIEKLRGISPMWAEAQKAASASLFA